MSCKAETIAVNHTTVREKREQMKGIKEMNKGIKQLIAVAAVAGLAASSYAGNITVNWSAFSNTGVALQGTTTGVPGGDFMEIGYWTGSSPTVGSSSLSGFVPWVTGQMGQGNAGGPGFFSIASGPSPEQGTATGINTRQIYMVIFNAATQGAATQMGIFSDTASNWEFPLSSSLTPTTGIDIENLVNNPATAGNSLAAGAQVIYGGGPAFLASDPQNSGGPSSYMQLKVIPEPSTWVLVGTGLLGLLGLRRRS